MSVQIPKCPKARRRVFAYGIRDHLRRLKAKIARRHARMQEAQAELDLVYRSLEDRIRKNTLPADALVREWGIEGVLLLRNTIWKKLNLGEVKKRADALRKATPPPRAADGEGALRCDRCGATPDKAVGGVDQVARLCLACIKETTP